MQKSKSIKKTLPYITRLMIILFLILIVPMNIYFQLKIQHQTQKKNCVEVFGQLEKLIENNEDNLIYAKNNFKNDCIKSADTVAYFVEKFPQIVHDRNRTNELAKKLGVDEIHYFNSEGEICGGSHPEYYGISFDSGEQMKFFKPMLKNKNLKLWQDITPNTAEEKKMQYAATWTRDGKNIVQIGMEPKHLLKIIEEKNLQNTIKMLPMEKNMFLHVIDKNNKKIISSTNQGNSIVGKDASCVLRKNDKKDGSINAFHLTYKNQRYCIYTKYYKNYLLVRSMVSKDSILNTMESTLLVLIYVLIVAVGVVGIIKWYINKKLIKNLTLIIQNLKKIEDGDMEKINISTEISEFDELLSYINHMLDKIRSNWDKISYIMDENNIPVGIFEINKFYRKVFINKYLIELFEIDNYEELSSEELTKLVEKKINDIELNIVDSRENIYEYCKNDTKSYIRIDKYVDKQSAIYYIIDISSWWSEINKLKEKSEIDDLTNLYNRRGFFEKIKQLFNNKEVLEYAMMMIIDADNLKKINDLYGHNIGDEYLKKIAEILDDIELKHISARLGGDEYAVFVYGASNIEDLEKIILKIKNRRGEMFICENNIEENIHYSMGVGYYPIDGKDIDSLTQIADKNMYLDKENKKEIYGR